MKKNCINKRFFLYILISLNILYLISIPSSCTLIQDFIPSESGDEPDTEETLEAFIAETLSAQQTVDHYQSTIAALQMTSDKYSAAVELAILNEQIEIQDDGSIKRTAKLSVESLGIGSYTIRSPRRMKLGESEIVSLIISS